MRIRLPAFRMFLSLRGSPPTTVAGFRALRLVGASDLDCTVAEQLNQWCRSQTVGTASVDCSGHCSCTVRPNHGLMSALPGPEFEQGLRLHKNVFIFGSRTFQQGTHSLRGSNEIRSNATIILKVRWRRSDHD